MDDLDDAVALDPHEALLYSARNGDVMKVKELLEAHKQGNIVLDINCKGYFQFILNIMIIFNTFNIGKYSILISKTLNID